MPATDYSSAMTWYYKPYNESEDITWDQKENRLYWTGSTMDGVWNDDSWRTSQRFRLVRDLNNGSKPISLLRQNGDSWEVHNSTMSALSEFVHVKFSDVRHCSEEECERMRDPKEGLALTSHEDIKESYGSKFAFDIDGHSYTERFQRLLHSHNTVFKMTIFQEWHDDFLVPWVHYVPVTLGMKELPETLRYVCPKLILPPSAQLSGLETRPQSHLPGPRTASCIGNTDSITNQQVLRGDSEGTRDWKSHRGGWKELGSRGVEAGGHEARAF